MNPAYLTQMLPAPFSLPEDSLAWYTHIFSADKVMNDKRNNAHRSDSKDVSTEASQVTSKTSIMNRKEKSAVHKSLSKSSAAEPPLPWFVGAEVDFLDMNLLAFDDFVMNFGAASEWMVRGWCDL